MKLFELLMLICFGCSWPLNIAKSVKTRSTKGKSIGFLLAVFVGYICGIINKILTGMDFVFYAYLLNTLMVGADIVLYFINLRRERAEERKAHEEHGSGTDRLGA